jgi:hypothetical protein
MDETSEAELPIAYLSIQGFFERLYSGEIVALRRDPGRGCEGTVLWGEGLLPEQRRFELAHEEFLPYAYDEDALFLAGVSGELARALAWVVGAPPMEEETIPGREQLHLARRLLRGTPAPWPQEPRAAGEGVLWKLQKRMLTPDEALAELVARAPATHSNLRPLCGAVVSSVAQGRLGRGDAMALLADGDVPERVGYAAYRDLLITALPAAAVPLDDALLLLQDRRPTAADYERYTRTGRVDALHGERELLLGSFAFLSTDARAVEALLDVIDNEACENAFTVKTAIWALGRQNDKAAIDRLIALLDQPQYRFYMGDVEDALSFVCSGAELVPPAAAEERAHWDAVSARLAMDDEGWWRHDAASVYWEKRLRCALTLDGHPDAADLADQLARDEVPIVRAASGS